MAAIISANKDGQDAMPKNGMPGAVMCMSMGPYRVSAYYQNIKTIQVKRLVPRPSTSVTASSER